MPYSELIKNFERVRAYMRDFYVYGFRSRDEYTQKSARSYDNEKRRLESWLGDYMRFRQTADGKNVFLSIDSRDIPHNPFFSAWKARSFTDGDITLHFLLMDILTETKLTLPEIMDAIDERLDAFENPRAFDESTVRKKLKEYISEGLIESEKQGRTVYYTRTAETPVPGLDFLDFFSEVSPCGVVGSFLRDKSEESSRLFAFKHHYITGSMDAGIMCDLFLAMGDKQTVSLELLGQPTGTIRKVQVVPLKILSSVQSGRQYLIAYATQFKTFSTYRLDRIVSVTAEGKSQQFDQLREQLNGLKSHIWGVSVKKELEHVDFTIRYDDEERFIPERLEREKRCGLVEYLDENTCRFSADVFDSAELIPWIRTFICRIVEVHFSNKELDARFRKDLQEMYSLYGIGGDSE